MMVVRIWSALELIDTSNDWSSQLIEPGRHLVERRKSPLVAGQTAGSLTGYWLFLAGTNLGTRESVWRRHSRPIKKSRRYK